ncbi:MAG: isocitrate lyase/PEP mutase family protein [Rhodospirillaceae bacterium]|jgi:2,3-dimethylmalate lyase|nr:isocitrate lyase/PEP mutase family protein [Rhodospirillaceae bacterium]MBT5456844.1 isocitrate lyase/PEP mutase family protein [Rhodospirillaceae bacterium]
MASVKEHRQRLKDLLAAPEIVVAPGCGDVVTARLVALAQLPAIHASGSVAHRTSGYADAGVLTMTEMVDRISALADGVDLPIIADADTGFGGPVNVVRTVREYERAGAAAIHIEDQLTPKRPTHMGYSGSFVTRGEMVDKIRAALDTRDDGNLLIIARCDVDDWDEKLERVAACVEAGADGAWLSARGAEQIQALSETAGKPTFGVLPQGMTLREYQDAGASCAVIPGALQISALCAQLSLLEELKQTGTAAGYMDTLPHVEEMRKFYGQQGNDELQRIEKEYSGGPAD